MDLGQFLKEVRSENELSLRDLARSSTVSASHISKIERGEHMPSTKTLIKIANALSIEPETLKKYNIMIFSKPKNIAQLRYEVFQRDDFTCQLCGGRAPDRVLEIAYILPIIFGGKEIKENAITLCSDCNLGRNKILKIKGIESDYLYKKFNNQNE